MTGWELVHDVAFERVRRFAVPNGHLYQVELDLTAESAEHGKAPIRTTGWGSAFFVPGDRR